MLHEIPAAVIRHDITVLLRHELGKIREEFSIDQALQERC